MLMAAVGQFRGTNVIQANLDACRMLVREAAQSHAKMLFLPEASDYIADNPEETKLLAEPIHRNVFLSGLRDEARERRLWISVGIHEPTGKDDLVYNTNVVINDLGSIVSKYRKLHLFDIDIKDGPTMLESATVARGDKVEPPVQTPVGNVGLCVCYDIRFPELSQRLRRLQADWLAYPSAFTVKTGQAHWEVLLRARAIETQCYVAAAAQVGRHNARRESFGNAMIVDPWGTVLARCPETVRPSIAVAYVDRELQERVRAAMPVLSHRRPDVFV